MNLFSVGNFSFSDKYTYESLFEKQKELQENLFEEIKSKNKPKDIYFSPFEFSYSSEITEGMDAYMMGYLKFHPNAHSLRKSENELMVIDGNKKLLVHFDNKGEVEYTEITEENGEYELSAGKYGKNKEEAVLKITSLYKEHGQTSEVVQDTVVVNKDDCQLQYKVSANGEVKKVNRAFKIEDCIGDELPIKLKEKLDENKSAFF